MMDREPEDLSKTELLRELERLKRIEHQFIAGATTHDPDRLIHDLQVHQVELEMQNLALREAQRELEHSRSRYADLYDFAPIGYCTIDVHGCVEQINLTGALMLGRERQHLIGKPLASLGSLLDHDFLQDHLGDCFRLKARVSTELRFSNGPGVMTVLQMVSTPARDADGVVRSCRSALIDISPAKHLETRLRFLADIGEWLTTLLDSQRTLASVARLSVPLLGDLCIVDVLEEDGSVKRVEAAFANPNRETHLKAELMRVAPRPNADTPQARVLASGEPIHLPAAESVESVATDHEYGRVMRMIGLRSLLVVPLASRGRVLGTLTLAFCESERRYSPSDLAFAGEVARRVALALDNAQLYRCMQQAVQARERLLAVVSHDLRNPLTAILMMASTLSRVPADEDRRSESRRALDRICQSAKSMGRLIGDLLDAASLEAGRFSIERGNHAVNALAHDALESLQATAAERSVQLVLESNETFLVSCDRDRVLQVFSNLIGNAFKYTDPGGTISVRSERRENDVLFEVRDTGHGIPPEQVPHLFDRFWQVKRSAHIGNGLGLSIAKGIIDAHGGKIWAESELEKGSSFFFTLPLVHDAGENQSAVSGKSVLLVDDDAESRAALGATLTDRGYRVSTASNGAEALEFLRNSPPPMVIFLDLVMPVMDGWTFLSERNSDPRLRDIPVVVLSGQPNVADQIEANNATFVSKPVAAKQLLNVLEQTHSTRN